MRCGQSQTPRHQCRLNERCLEEQGQDAEEVAGSEGGRVKPALRRRHEGGSKERWGPMGGGRGGGGAADRQADSSAVTDDRAKQRLARDSRPALSSHSKNKKQRNTLASGCLPAAFRDSRVRGVFSGTPGSAPQSDTPKGENVEL